MITDHSRSESQVPQKSDKNIMFMTRNLTVSFPLDEYIKPYCVFFFYKSSISVCSHSGRSCWPLHRLHHLHAAFRCFFTHHVWTRIGGGCYMSGKKPEVIMHLTFLSLSLCSHEGVDVLTGCHLFCWFLSEPLITL